MECKNLLMKLPHTTGLRLKTRKAYASGSQGLAPRAATILTESLFDKTLHR